MKPPSLLRLPPTVRDYITHLMQENKRLDAALRKMERQYSALSKEHDKILSMPRYDKESDALCLALKGRRYEDI